MYRDHLVSIITISKPANFDDIKPARECAIKEYEKKTSHFIFCNGAIIKPLAQRHHNQSPGQELIIYAD